MTYNTPPSLRCDIPIVLVKITKLNNRHLKFKHNYIILYTHTADYGNC